VALPFTFKKYLKAKQELFMETQIIILPCKNNKILPKNPLKETQNPSRYYYNSIITNLEFQHKPKYHLSKILI
jgi:hypothetical protein